MSNMDLQNRVQAIDADMPRHPCNAKEVSMPCCLMERLTDSPHNTADVKGEDEFCLLHLHVLEVILSNSDYQHVIYSSALQVQDGLSELITRQRSPEVSLHAAASSAAILAALYKLPVCLGPNCNTAPDQIAAIGHGLSICTQHLKEVNQHILHCLCNCTYA